jgi:hypothetical protein
MDGRRIPVGGRREVGQTYFSIFPILLFPFLRDDKKSFTYEAYRLWTAVY